MCFFSLGEISSDGTFVTGKFIQWIQKRGQEQIFFRKKFQKKMCDSNQIFFIFNTQCELYCEVCCDVSKPCPVIIPNSSAFFAQL